MSPKKQLKLPGWEDKALKTSEHDKLLITLMRETVWEFIAHLALYQQVLQKRIRELETENKRLKAERLML